MKLYWIRVGPKANVTGVLISRGAERDTQGEGPVMTETEVGVCKLRNAKDCRNHRKLEETWEGFSSRRNQSC